MTGLGELRPKVELFREKKGRIGPMCLKISSRGLKSNENKLLQYIQQPNLNVERPKAQTPLHQSKLWRHSTSSNLKNNEKKHRIRIWIISCVGFSSSNQLTCVESKKKRPNLQYDEPQIKENEGDLTRLFSNRTGTYSYSPIQIHFVFSSAALFPSTCESFNLIEWRLETNLCECQI